MEPQRERLHAWMQDRLIAAFIAGLHRGHLHGRHCRSSPKDWARKECTDARLATPARTQVFHKCTTRHEQTRPTITGPSRLCTDNQAVTPSRSSQNRCENYDCPGACLVQPNRNNSFRSRSHIKTKSCAPTSAG